MLRDMFKKTYTKIDMKYRAGEKESARTATSIVMFCSRCSRYSPTQRITVIPLSRAALVRS